MKLKVLYIDAVYPHEWLAQKQVELNLASMDFAAYRQWIINQRVYLSDYITHQLERQGFGCETIIANDPLFIDKLDSFLNGKKRTRLDVPGGYKNRIRKIAGVSLMGIYRHFRPTPQQKRDRVILKAFEYYRPEIIFVREPTGVDSYFWNRFRPYSLVAGLIGCNTLHPYRWLSHNFDVIYTLTDEYYRFFDVQGIPAYLFRYGIDERVYKELQNISGKKFDVVFVGLLGSEVQTAKTALLEAIAEKFNFRWWGPLNVNAEKYPVLSATYQGHTSGIEMLRIYRQARIVVNDYVDTAKGKAVNMRLYEVVNTGSFLLTRDAENLKTVFPAELLSTYKNATECIDQINYFLSHETEREARAAELTKWALENLPYSKAIAEIGETLRSNWIITNEKRRVTAG